MKQYILFCAGQTSTDSSLYGCALKIIPTYKAAWKSTSGGDAPRQFDVHTGEMSGARSRTVLLVEFMEAHKIPTLWNAGLGGPCGPARKNKVPTRADLCYGVVVDREIVATKCA